MGARTTSGLLEAKDSDLEAWVVVHGKCKRVRTSSVYAGGVSHEQDCGAGRISSFLASGLGSTAFATPLDGLRANWTESEEVRQHRAREAHGRA